MNGRKLYFDNKEAATAYARDAALLWGGQWAAGYDGLGAYVTDAGERGAGVVPAVSQGCCPVCHGRSWRYVGAAGVIRCVTCSRVRAIVTDGEAVRR